MPARQAVPLSAHAVIVDLDGVVTDTASTHFSAWKEVLDPLLARLEGEAWEPFEREDYLAHVDGRPREEGLRKLLESRGLVLGEEALGGDGTLDSVASISRQKNEAFQRLLSRGAFAVYAPTVAWLKALRARGLRTAVVSSSRNCARILEAAGITALFDVRVDATDMARGLRGKPAPDMFLEASRRLGVPAAQSVVVEDALVGVEAARAGDFGLVVGLARHEADEEEALYAHGAHVVLRNLEPPSVGQLEVDWQPAPPMPAPEAPRPWRALRPGELLHAHEQVELMARRLEGRQLVSFLDFDGTLTPIVERPELAQLSSGMREVLKSLGRFGPVAVISGRDLEDVRRRVGVEGLSYAGSHGFDLVTATGHRIQAPEAGRFVPTLEQLARALRQRTTPLQGVYIEHKRFSVAVHYRQVRDADVERLESIVDEVLRSYGEVRKTHGKRVFDLQPDLPWDKGMAVRYLMGLPGMGGPGALALYVGDDVTDEDAFRALAPEGLTIVVHDPRAERGLGPSELGGAQARRTYARYALDNPGEVEQFLRQLVGRLEAGA